MTGRIKKYRGVEKGRKDGEVEGRKELMSGKE